MNAFGRIELFSDPNPIVSVFIIGAMALLPFLLLAVSSFLKLSVVFGILKNAIGAQQVPSGAILSLLSIVLSLQIMTPVVKEIGAVLNNSTAAGPAVAPKSSFPAKLTIAELWALAGEGIKPLERFLRRHSAQRERMFFAGLQQEGSSSNVSGSIVPDSPVSEDVGTEDVGTDGEVQGESILSLVSAFILTELKEAFAIGFTIYLPFLVVDLVIANLLLGLGMNMVNPVSISLPFKLMLFVLCDGWFLLTRGLVLGYIPHG